MNEFNIINKYLKPLTKNNLGSLNLNDDIYYNKKRNIVISVDTYTEGVHFVNSNDPKKFLKKIIRASFSDLYCKGVSPNTYFLSWSLNKKLTTPNWLKRVKHILKSEQKKFNVSLGGGDTTYSSKFTMTIIVLGYSNKPILRKGCNNNDDIYMTGNIGDSYLGLNILKKKKNFGKLNSYFLKKYYEPEIPIKLSPYLKNFASSSIDISDGLVQDLQHLCNQSNFGAILDLNSIPLSNNCKKLIKNKKINLKKIFSKGDDYQIIFTSSIKNRSKILNLSRNIKVKISRIGLINKEKNIIFKYSGNKFMLNAQNIGYTHNFK